MTNILIIPGGSGMATLGEIEEAVFLFQKYNVPLLLFHCITSYPALVDESNLHAIKTLPKTQ
ncbi:MAG: N-acetylneuraminate synthase family protein [Nanoarchaeota archaeon]